MTGHSVVSDTPASWTGVAWVPVAMDRTAAASTRMADAAGKYHMTRRQSTGSSSATMIGFPEGQVRETRSCKRLTLWSEVRIENAVGSVMACRSLSIRARIDLLRYGLPPSTAAYEGG